MSATRSNKTEIGLRMSKVLNFSDRVIETYYIDHPELN